MVKISVKSKSNAIFNFEKSQKGGIKNPSKRNLWGKKNNRFASDMLQHSATFKIRRNRAFAND